MKGRKNETIKNTRRDGKKKDERKKNRKDKRKEKRNNSVRAHAQLRFLKLQV
jgi:hypothetical protein